MSLGKLLSLTMLIGLAGCSSSPNYTTAANCGSLTPLCLAAAAIDDAITNNKSSSKKCSDLTGEERKTCEAQVKVLNKHIDDANKNKLRHNGTK